MRSVAVLALCIVAGAAFPDLFGTQQSVAVQGTLMCDGAPAKAVKVKLYDEDTLDIDDLLAEDFSDDNGRFWLNGTETEVTSIDPKLNIYHRCHHDWPCPKKVTIYIPKTFITEGPEAEKTFDAGAINLAAQYEGESLDCIN